MKLLISLVTRSRPQQLIATVNRMIGCWRHPNTRMILQIDEDDQPTIDAMLMTSWDDAKIGINIAPREDTIGGKINRALSEPADLYMIGADDDPPITEGYDALYLEAAERFEDGIGMVYGHMANLSFPCTSAVTARLAEMWGFIQPDLFPYWFIDHWTDDLVKIMGRVSYADVVSDRSNVGKTMELREPAWWATWFDAAYLMRRKQAHDVIEHADFKATAKQKEMLLRQHPVVEMRSRWINDTVRAQARQLEGVGGLKTDEPRYKRLRDRHAAMIPQLLQGMDPKEATMFQHALIPPTVITGLQRAFG